VIENDVEQDHLGVKAGQIVDHLGVIRVEPRVRAQVVLRSLVDGHQRYAWIRRRGGKQLILGGVKRPADHAQITKSGHEHAGDEARQREAPGQAPVADPLADHAPLS